MAITAITILGRHRSHSGLQKTMLSGECGLRIDPRPGNSFNGMPDIRFGCTLCGKCCQNHSIPLTLDESISWLEDGGKVEIFCEAHLDSAAGSPSSEHHRKRSFPVTCGVLQARVTAIFVGVVSGDCRNLTPDLKCRIYERRPLVCRIYPAEISPFIQLDVAAKMCPPEAWTSGEVLVPDGRLADPNLEWLVNKSRQTDFGDATRKMAACRELNLAVSAISEEGYAAYRPEPGRLLDVLRSLGDGKVSLVHDTPRWRLHSPSALTAQALRTKGYDAVSEKRPQDGYVFLHGAKAKAPVPELA